MLCLCLMSGSLLRDLISQHLKMCAEFYGDLSCLFFFFFQVLSDYPGVGGSRIHVKCYFTAKELENQNTGG